MTWKIYYANGTTFDSTQGGPEDAPTIGVIVIKQKRLDGKWEMSAYRDYYIWEGEWWNADAPGFWMYMFKSGLKIVKFGTNIPDVPFFKMLAEAREDILNNDQESRIT